MTPFFVDYATPSALESTRDRAVLGLSADRRRPVRFHARVKKEHRVGFRFALQALGDVVWSNDEWIDVELFRMMILDPIITVHPDFVFFEGFSQDQSAYGMVRFDRAIFETEGEVICGTTNVDFTAWLRAALAEMRSSRDTWLRIEPAGFEIASKGAGGRFEKKVEIPETWIRGFLSLQAAMAMPGTRLNVRPVDLLAAIRFLKVLKAKVAPRAVRFEMDPGQDAKIILEPWEHLVPLVGADHTYAEKRVIRTWGRRRLKLLEPVLPYADQVEIYLKGRALPHFYRVEMSGASFLLGLSGWSENKFSSSGGLSLLSGMGSNEAPPGTEAAAASLAANYHGNGDPAAMSYLVRAGRAFYDLERREYRHRELFDKPIDLPSVFPPDAQLIASKGMAVTVTSALPRETKKTRRLKTPDGPVMREIVYRDWQVFGSAGDQPQVEAVLNGDGRLIFGKCGCKLFVEHHLSEGPCAHLIALVTASESQRRDLPTSTLAPAEHVEDNDE